MENVFNSIIEFLSGTGLHIAQAIVVFLLGLLIIKGVVSMLKTAIIKGTNKKTVATFICSIVNVVLTFLLIMVVFNILSISTNGLMELLSACVLAVGLSLKDSVSHIASGLIIVSTNPFKEGDKVQINGLEGVVKSVNIFNTHIVTPDNKIVIVPNSSVVGNNIVNYDTLATRRVDINLYVSYDSDIELCKKVFAETAARVPKVLKVPAPVFVLNEFGDSSLVFSARVWTRKENYWDVRNALMEEYYKDMVKAGIDIPFNQLDVFIKNKNTKDIENNQEEVIASAAEKQVKTKAKGKKEGK